MTKLTETFYLIIPDRERRAACFTALAAGPPRIIRGFARYADFLAERPNLPDGCVIVDLGPGQLAELRAVLLALVGDDRMAALVVADAVGVDDALALIRAGVRDIVPAPVSAADVARRAEGLVPALAMQRNRRVALASAQDRLGRLSPRERDIVVALAAGQSNKQIARDLTLSPRTVEVHRANIMRRAEVASLAELLRLHFLTETSHPFWRIAG